MAANTFHLGDWQVEPDLNLLLGSDGEEVKLEPKLMDVLVYLASRQGDVISSGEIVDAVWGGQPMSDNPVYNAIGRLRQVLGDDPKHPEYIQTISSRGYRVVAKVSDATAASSEMQATAQSVDGSKSRSVRLILVAAAAAGLVAAISYLYPEAPRESPAHKLVSSFPGSHEMPSFSADGSRIAFVSDEAGTAQVWVVHLTTMQRRQLTHTERSSVRPRWSPVEDNILYQTRGSIWIVSAKGGDDRQLVQSGINADWSPDGSRFVFERLGDIWIADADGSNQNRVEGPPARDLVLASRRPSYSPDGANIAYYHAPISPLGDWWIVAVAGGSPKQLTFDKARSGWATWTPDGQFLVVSSQRAGSRTLWRIPVAGGQPEPVLISAGDDDEPDISGEQLIYSTRQDRFTLCVTNFETGETKELFSSAFDIHMPRFSPDESEIAFFTMLDTGDIQVLAVSQSGGQERHVTTDNGARNQAHDWSADGDSMFFYRTEPAPAFMQNDAHGGPAEIVADGWNWIKENGAQVHPTKPKIIYSRMDRVRATATMIRDLSDGTDTIFPEVLYRPKWSHSGDMLAGMRHSQEQWDELVVCDEQGIDCRSLGQNGWEPTWSRDDARLFFQRPGPNGMAILSVSIVEGEVEQHGTIGPILPIGSFYDVSAEHEIAWVRYDRGTGELWLTRIVD